MKRRALLLTASSASVVGAQPGRLASQTKSMAVVCSLNVGTSGPNAPFVAAFLSGLASAGFVEGRNVIVEHHWAEERPDRLPAMAADLVRRKVDVIVTSGGIESVRAAKAATSSIPIVFGAYNGDPVADGLVASLARPGGNVTGIVSLVNALNLKRLELLSEVVPESSHFFLLVNPTLSVSLPAAEHVRQAAVSKGLKLELLKASNEAEIDEVFASAFGVRGQPLVVTADQLFGRRRQQIISLTSRYSVPAIFSNPQSVSAGGLMSYGASVVGIFQQVGVYVGRILNGTSPAGLPVEQPTAYNLSINITTAKALKLNVPPTILAMANEIIE